jgi:hypothetical protein
MVPLSRPTPKLRLDLLSRDPLDIRGVIQLAICLLRIEDINRSLTLTRARSNDALPTHRPL